MNDPINTCRPGEKIARAIALFLSALLVILLAVWFYRSYFA